MKTKWKRLRSWDIHSVTCDQIFYWYLSTARKVSQGWVTICVNSEPALHSESVLGNSINSSVRQHRNMTAIFNTLKMTEAAKTHPVIFQVTSGVMEKCFPVLMHRSRMVVVVKAQILKAQIFTQSASGLQFTSFFMLVALVICWQASVTKAVVYFTLSYLFACLLTLYS